MQDLILKNNEIFKGTSNEFSASVALNTAAGLIVSGKEKTLKLDFQNSFEALKFGKGVSSLN